MEPLVRPFFSFLPVLTCINLLYMPACIRMTVCTDPAARAVFPRAGKCPRRHAAQGGRGARGPALGAHADLPQQPAGVVLRCSFRRRGPCRRCAALLANLCTFHPRRLLLLSLLLLLLLLLLSLLLCGELPVFASSHTQVFKCWRRKDAGGVFKRHSTAHLHRYARITEPTRGFPGQQRAPV